MFLSQKRLGLDGKDKVTPMAVTNRKGAGVDKTKGFTMSYSTAILNNKHNAFNGNEVVQLQQNCSFTNHKGKKQT